MFRHSNAAHRIIRENFTRMLQTLA